jgi:septum formation protein
MTDGENIRLVLASQSPRRVELLKSLGLQFEVVPSNIDEKFDVQQDPAKVCELLAAQKADAVAGSLADAACRTLVLAADTIVVLGKDILGKPSSREDAYQMLMRMSGRCHRVFTGVAVFDCRTRQMLSDHEASDVYFRSLDSAEVRAYARTEEPMDKAGAYALQGTASAFIDKIDGCYTNVIGLPVPLTVKMLRGLGLRILGMP